MPRRLAIDDTLVDQVFIEGGLDHVTRQRVRQVAKITGEQGEGLIGEDLILGVHSADRLEFVIVAGLRGFLGPGILDRLARRFRELLVIDHLGVVHMNLVDDLSVEIDIVLVVLFLVLGVQELPLESQRLLQLADDSRENLAKDLGEPGSLDRVIARGNLCTINKVALVVAGDGRVADQFQESVKAFRAIRRDRIARHLAGLILVKPGELR